MIKYFKGCQTLEELKAEYKRLVFKHHPDRGGDTAAMQEINAEYDDLFPRLKNVHKNKEGKQYEKETSEAPGDFKDLIEKLIKMEGCHIEVIGSFIWVSGNTKRYKEDLKLLGFKWHSKKLCWYKAPEGYKRRGSTQYDMSEIRDMYGVTFEADGQASIKLTA